LGIGWYNPSFAPSIAATNSGLAFFVPPGVAGSIFAKIVVGDSGTLLPASRCSGVSKKERRVVVAWSALGGIVGTGAPNVPNARDKTRREVNLVTCIEERVWVGLGRCEFSIG